jgi:sigma-B regulation protein RsbQ
MLRPSMLLAAVVIASYASSSLCGCASSTQPGPSASAPAAPACTPTASCTAPSAFDQVPIHYAVAGEGDPAVVLVHCWGCSMKTWENEVPALGARWRVVTLDLAGHGDSGKGRKEWTVAGFAEDVRAVVETLGLRRVVLVGHSMGGPIVLEAAQRMADRVVGIVVVDTLLDVDSEMPAEKKAEFFGKMRADFKGTVSSFLPHLFAPNTDRAFIDRIVAMETANDPAMMVPAIENVFNYDERAALSRIKVPIRGVNADLFPTSVEHNRKYAPQFDADVVHGVGHWLMLERPDEFNAKLVAAIDLVTAARRGP